MIGTSIHIDHGDHVLPEGMCTLEAVCGLGRPPLAGPLPAGMQPLPATQFSEQEQGSPSLMVPET